MRRSFRFPVILSLLFLGAWALSDARADTIWKRDGTRLIGKVLEEEPKRVLVEFTQGKISGELWIDRSDIFRIEKGLTPQEQFQERLAKLGETDLKGHELLVVWAKENDLREEARDLEKKLPLIRHRRLKLDNPHTWCRTCDASGIEKCAQCEGDGKVLEPCERCEGSGTIRCKTCGLRDSTLLRCRRCGGEGEYERFDPEKARKVRVECRDCKGKGTHTCPTCEGQREQPCPYCKGRKGIEHACQLCKGTPQKTCTTCGGEKLQPTRVTAEVLARERAEAEKRSAEKGVPGEEGGAKGDDKTGGKGDDETGKKGDATAGRTKPSGG